MEWYQWWEGREAQALAKSNDMTVLLEESERHKEAFRKFVEGKCNTCLPLGSSLASPIHLIIFLFIVRPCNYK